jgi:TonB-dependent receptor
LVIITVGGAFRLKAQSPAVVTGRVTDSTGKGLPAAVIRVLGTRFGDITDSEGRYRVVGLPGGVQRLAATAPGYFPDTQSVTVTLGATTPSDFRLRVNVAQLSAIVITASPRLAETKGAALDSMRRAIHLTYVESGDDIRSLPSLNAAEAAERIPGVSTERDEGEGKFIQIRGTEPKLATVTIDGAHVPGTLSGDRSVKLDDVPSDVLGAIEVQKTLSADRSAAGIGGTVDLVTKMPESSPRGYVSGLFGESSLDSRTAGQGGFTYGGRVGPDQKLGFLLGGSYDRNNRPIEDIEPFWGAQASGSGFYPNDFNQRYYLYDRDRYGVNADLDYRPDSATTMLVRGLYSRFLNHGFRYVWDLASNADSAGAANIGTQGSSGRQVEHRTPTENTFGFTAGLTKRNVAGFQMDAGAYVSGSDAAEKNYRNSNFTYTGSDVLYRYDNSNVLSPKYVITDPSLQASLLNPSNFALSGYDYSTSTTTATEVGGHLDLRRQYALGSMPAALKLGVSFGDLSKKYDQNGASYGVTSAAPPTLASFLGGSTNSSYYREEFPSGINLGPMPSFDATQAYESANPSAFALQPGNAVGNALSNYDGTERVASAYVMHDVDNGPLHINLGLRVESTMQHYRGYADTVTADFNSPTSVAGVQAVSGGHTYTDLFPSAQLRYAIDDQTDARIAVTRGISRPDYTSLAPTTTGTPNSQVPGGAKFNNSVSIGNPNLHAEYAWNYDFMVNHYLPADGVVSAGVFYKGLSEVIYNQRFQNYAGPILAYQGAGYTVPLNGGNGHLLGWEADWEQHLTMLPGVWKGLGFDANWTHVNSSVLLPNGTFDSTAAGFVPVTLPSRRAPLFRTSPNVANVSGIYSYGPVYARVAWYYQGANITGYGDGSNDPTSGDTYFYAHSQIDMSLYYTYRTGTQIQVQLLNANDAVFGFFNGSLQRQFDIQREYYGRTLYVGFRQAIP